MDKQQIENLIASMPFDEKDKINLLDDLKNNLPTKVIMEKLGKLISQKEKSLNESNPEPAKAYAEINDDYNKEVEKAEGEFDQKMEAIEKEAEEIDRDVSKKLDDIRIEELKDNLG